VQGCFSPEVRSCCVFSLFWLCDLFFSFFPPPFFFFSLFFSSCPCNPQKRSEQEKAEETHLPSLHFRGPLTLQIALFLRNYLPYSFFPFSSFPFPLSPPPGKNAEACARAMRPPPLRRAYFAQRMIQDRPLVARRLPLFFPSSQYSDRRKRQLSSFLFHAKSMLDMSLFLPLQDRLRSESSRIFAANAQNVPPPFFFSSSAFWRALPYQISRRPITMLAGVARSPFLLILLTDWWKGN